MLSKAFDMCSSTKIDTLLLSIASNRSSVTQIRAVSVEWSYSYHSVGLSQPLGNGWKSNLSLSGLDSFFKEGFLAYF